MTVQSNDTDLKDLLYKINKGEIQLPEFQRSWVWDDSKICKLIESITMGYPMGALMFLETGGGLKYKSRLLTNVDEKYKCVQPDFLVLDGQQRLTTLYQVFYNQAPVKTCWERNRSTEILRYYYIDMRKAVDENEDIEDAIVSISNKKIISTDIGKTIALDLTTRTKEFENLMFPLNLIFNPAETTNWLMQLMQHYSVSSDIMKLYQEFNDKVIQSVMSYKLPVIKVLKNTSQASVCQIFENVNRGGVPLNVFELVTASLAADGIELREVWKKIKKDFNAPQYEVLNDVSGTDFITSMTLWESYEQSTIKNTGVKCKKKDVMGLQSSVFNAKKDVLKDAFIDAARFLINQGIYTSANLPYSTQYIPLAAIFAYDNTHKKVLNTLPNLTKLSQWYWCGVFGELYGSANETRYALDIKDFFAWVDDDSAVPDTVARSSFQTTRLLTLQTRNSAAYKGIMALVLQDMPLDFATSVKMSVANYTLENTDIHHIFPASYCEKTGLPNKKWNSIVNKTMISASTNRSIGGVAPSKYIQKLFKDNSDVSSVKDAIRSHKIDFDLLNEDRFDEFINDRAKKLLDRIEQATGKSVTGRDSQETIEAFGSELI